MTKASTQRQIIKIRTRNRMLMRMALLGGLAIFVIVKVLYFGGGDQQVDNISPDSTIQSPSISRSLKEVDDESYPDPDFTDDELKNGAVILYVIGTCYTFLALAIVCDEFFVPALEVITEKLDVSEDVAGATFMAAGGSAPELFTSFIGTFLAESNVGFGTIVGSAVFNVLFVVAACAFAADNLKLTYWPLARDTIFYSAHLITLTIFFEDQEFAWWESLIMFLLYCSYVAFMSKNEQVQLWFLRQMRRRRLRKESVAAGDPDMLAAAEEEAEDEDKELAAIKAEFPDELPFQMQDMRRLTMAQFRANPRLSFHTGALAMMLANMEDETPKTKFKAAGKVVIARIRELKTPKNADDGEEETTMPEEKNGKSNMTMSDAVVRLHSVDGDKPSSESGGMANAVRMVTMKKASEVDDDDDDEEASEARAFKEAQEEKEARDREIRKSRDNAAGGSRRNSRSLSDVAHEALRRSRENSLNGERENPEDEARPGPLDLVRNWSKYTCKQRFFVILISPIVLPLGITLFDVSKVRWKKWFMWTFFGSIIWIGLFSYLMVWWATVIGDVAGIPIEVMGLTFLAAGTSVPDLLTSVIVASKGFGDMAVSSSLGSNIFDVGVGLPLPWLFYALINNKPIEVGTDGLFISVIVLFAMLACVILTIMYNKWVLTRKLGIAMFVLYAVFLTQNLLVEFDVV